MFSGQPSKTIIKCPIYLYRYSGYSGSVLKYVSESSLKNLLDSNKSVHCRMICNNIGLATICKVYPHLEEGSPQNTQQEHSKVSNDSVSIFLVMAEVHRDTNNVRFFVALNCFFLLSKVHCFRSSFKEKL